MEAALWHHPNPMDYLSRAVDCFTLPLTCQLIKSTTGGCAAIIEKCRNGGANIGQAKGRATKGGEREGWGAEERERERCARLLLLLPLPSFISDGNTGDEAGERGGARGNL